MDTLERRLFVSLIEYAVSEMDRFLDVLEVVVSSLLL